MQLPQRHFHLALDMLSRMNHLVQLQTCFVGHMLFKPLFHPDFETV